MAVSKVIVNGTTRVDLTSDTVTADKLMSSYTAHDAAGLAITGTAIPGSDGQPIRNDVTFVDYDGTVLYGYSATAFAALTAMPANPTHTGLTAQGWNWTLSDAKTYVANYGKLIIGQLYTTSDGKTRLYITIEDSLLCDLAVQIKKARDVSSANGTIDWGDGTTGTDYILQSNYSGTWFRHQYASVGSYVITISVSNSAGAIIFGGSTSDGYFLIHPYSKYQTSAGNTALPYMTLLKKVEIGDKVKGFEGRSFCSATNLETISVPNTVEYIGYYAFLNCRRLKAFVSDSTLVDSGGTQGNVFSSCFNLETVSLSKKATFLPSYAFSYCYSLKYITLPDTLTETQSYVFQYTNISEISLPDSFTTLGYGTFQYCHNLKTVRLSTNANFTSLPTSAFEYCESLQSIAIPSNVTSISNSVFGNCNALEYVTMSNIVSIGQRAFYYCYSLRSITLPNTLTTLGQYVFQYAGITRIVLPSTVTSVGANLFANTPELVTASLPEGITTITGMFDYASALTYITVPSTVTSLGNYTFRYGYSLKEIHFLPTTPPTASSSNCFTSLPTTCKIYVPSGSLSAYTSATNYPSSSSYTYVTE